MEARGRKERDYFHDLYQRQTTRKELQDKIQANPHNSAYYKEQLAFLDQVDADRRQDIMARSAELDRVLGISPSKSKERAEQKQTQTPAEGESVTEPTPDHAPEPEHVPEEEKLLEEIEQRPVTSEPEKPPAELIRENVEQHEKQDEERQKSENEDLQKQLDEMGDRLDDLIKRLEEREKELEAAPRRRARNRAAHTTSTPLTTCMRHSTGT